MTSTKIPPLGNLSEAVVMLASVFRILTPEEILAEIEYVNQNLETPELLTPSAKLREATYDAVVNLNPIYRFKFQSPLVLAQQCAEILAALVNIVKRSKKDIQHPLKNAGAELFQEYQYLMLNLSIFLQKEHPYSIYGSPQYFVFGTILVDLFAYSYPELVKVLKTYGRETILTPETSCVFADCEDPNRTPEQQELLGLKLLCCIFENGYPVYRLTSMGTFNLLLIEKLEELGAVGFITETFKQN